MKAKFYIIVALMIILFIPNVLQSQTVTIDCTAPTTVSSCGSAQYTYTITNSGNVPFTIMHSFNLGGVTITNATGTNNSINGSSINFSAFTGTVQCTVTIALGCSSIPTSGNSTNFTSTISASSNATPFSYRINAGTLNQPSALNSTFTFPQLDNANDDLLNVSIDACNGGDATFYYTNGGSSSFSGVVRVHNPVCGNFTATQVTINRISGGSATQIFLTSNPFSSSSTIDINFSNNSVAPNDQISITYHIVQNCTNGCITSAAGVFPLSINCAGTCQTAAQIQWGCNANDLCRNINRDVQYEITTQLPQLRLTRVLPSPPAFSNANIGVWDAACSGQDTEWQYLIENTGNGNCAIARNVILSLFNNFLDNGNNTYTRIVPGSIHITTSALGGNPLSLPTIPTSLTLNGMNTANPFTVTGNADAIQSACFSPADPTITNYVVRIPEMLPGQAFLLRFVTRRCCASASPFNTDILYNRWQLSLTAQNYCGNPVSIDQTPHTFGTVNVFDPFVYPNDAPKQNSIGNNMHEVLSSPELRLVQTIQQPTFTLIGGKGSCGPYTEFVIDNQSFPTTFLNAYAGDAELFSACTGPVPSPAAPGGFAGATPRGQFTVRFNVPTGIGFDNNTPQPVFVSNGGTWTPLSWAPTANPPTAVFDMDNLTGLLGSNFTSHDFRLFFHNARLRFNLRACCPTNTAQANIYVETLFTPQVQCPPTPACNCQIPLSRVPITLNIECPGCVTPGIIVENYTLQRNTFGYTDHNDDRIADGNPTLINPTSYSQIGMLNLGASLPGDELIMNASGFFQEGDPTTAFNYAGWQNYWQQQNGITPVLRHIYLEQIVQNGVAAGISIAGPTTVQLLRLVNGVWTQQGSIITMNPVNWAVTDNAGGTRMLTGYVTDSDFGNNILFQESDRFVFRTTYRLCNNPGSNSPLQLLVNTRMYLTQAPTTIAHAFQNNAPTAVTEFQNAAPTNPLASRVSPNTNNLLFYCEANGALHNLYGIEQEAVEDWQNPNQCSKPGYLRYNQRIANAVPNMFRCEVRTLPDVQNMIDGPVYGSAPTMPLQFYATAPAGFTVSINNMHSLAPSWADPFNPINLRSDIAPTATNSPITPNQTTQAAGTSVMYSVNVNHMNYTVPNTNMGLNTQTTTFQSLIYNGQPALLLGDEEFTQAASFTATVICKTDPAIPNIGLIIEDSYSVVAPELTNTCNTLNGTSIGETSPAPVTLTYPSYNFTTTVGSPSNTGTTTTFPLTVNIPPNAVNNLTFYLNFPISSSATILCLNNQPNCSGTPIPGIVSGTAPNQFVRYLLGNLTSNSYNYWIQLQTLACNANVNFTGFLSWDCDAEPQPIVNKPLCSQPANTIQFNYTAPLVQVNVTTPNNPTTFTGCTATTYNACIKSTLLGAIGNITAQFNFPSAITGLGTITNASATLTHNPPAGGSPIATTTPANFTLNGNSALFNLTTYTPVTGTPLPITSFSPPASVVGNDGLNNNDSEMCISFNLTPNCNTLNIGSVGVQFSYNQYCNLNNTVTTGTQNIPARNIAPVPNGDFDGCVILPTLTFVDNCTNPQLNVTPIGQSSYTWAVPSPQANPCLPASSCLLTSITPQAWGNYAVSVSYAAPNAGCVRAANTTINSNNIGVEVGSGANPPTPTIQDAINAGLMLPISGTPSNAQNTVQHIKINGTLEVNVTFSNFYRFFNGSTIQCQEGAEIFVPSGMTLQLIGSTANKVVAYGCSTLWRGIRAQEEQTTPSLIAGGHVYLDNATIRDAQYGIRFNHRSRMTVWNSKFENCFVGIYFNTGTLGRIIPSQGGFRNNTFEGNTNTFLPPYNNMINDPNQPSTAAVNAVRSSWAGMHLVDLEEMRIGVIGQPENKFSNVTYGIVMSNGDLSVVASKFSSMPEFKQNSIYYGGLDDGTCVFITNDPGGFVTNRSLYIRGRGVIPVNNTAVDVHRFVYSQGLNVNIDSVRISSSNIGIEVRNTKFATIRIGTLVSGSMGSPPVTAASNIFTSIANRGIWLVNNDPSRVINIAGNDITIAGHSHTSGPNSLFGRAIEITENSTPNMAFICDNRITVANRAWHGILLQNCNGFNGGNFSNYRVYNNTITLQTAATQSKNRSGIQLENCHSVLAVQNNVTGSSPTLTFTNGGVAHPIAYNLANTNDVFFNCNQSHNIYTGYRFSGFHNNLEFSANRAGPQGNTGQTSTFGLRVENLSTMPPQDKRGNRWHGSFGAGWGALNGNINQANVSQFLIHTTNGAPFWPPSIWVASVGTPWFVFDPSSTYTECMAPFVQFGASYKTDEEEEGDGLDSLDYALINQNLDFAEYHEPMQWQGEKRVLEKIETNPDLIANNEVAQFYNNKLASSLGAVANSDRLRTQALALDTAVVNVLEQLQNQKDSLFQLLLANDASLDSNATPQQTAQWIVRNEELTGAIAQTNQLLQSTAVQPALSISAAVQTALADNSNVTPTANVELWHKQINEVYLNTLAVGVHQFTPPQISVVESIAFTCPLVGGEATYRARGMYAVVKDTMYDDQQLCAAAGIYYKKEVSSVSQSSKGEQPKFTVYPNPAKDITTIECNQPLANECEISITDNRGSVVQQMQVNFTDKKIAISTEKFSSGLYLIRITTSTGLLSVHKLNVIH